MRPKALALALVACLAAAPESIFAQQLTALRAGAHRTESVPSYRSDLVPLEIAESSKQLVPRWPFVLGGALIGGAAAGGWYAYQVSKSDDPMLDLSGPVIAIGTVGGALVGLIVAEVVRGIQDSPSNNRSQSP